MVAIEKKISILNADMIISREELNLRNPVKSYGTNFNFVTISSASAKDVRIDDHSFDKPLTIVSDYLKERTIRFTIDPGTLKEVIWNASRILIGIFKAHATDSGRPLKGFEFLYLKKVKIYKDNIIEFKIEKMLN